MKWILLFLLFKVSGNSAANPSYILATNRYVDMTFADSIPGVFKAFGRCQRVVTEFAFEDYELLGALRQVEYKPSYAYTSVRDSILSRRFAYNPNRSIETFFQRVAEDKNMSVTGLDAVGETLYMLFNRNDEEYQMKMLNRILEYAEDDVDLEREIISLYKRGQLSDIAYAVSGPNNKATFGYSDYIVYTKRNVIWAQRLTPILKQGGAFITLNALYLGGEKGLLEQLRKAGFKVKEVKK